MRFFKRNKKVVAPVSIVALINKVSSSESNTFRMIKKDLENFVTNVEEKEPQPQYMMPILYAYRLSIAGLFAQGLISKKDFDEADRIHFNMMVYVGDKTTKDEQVDYQETSYNYALDFINTYEINMDKITAGRMVLAAKAGF